MRSESTVVRLDECVIPHQIIVAFIDHQGHTGNYKQNPFAFENFGIQFFLIQLLLVVISIVLTSFELLFEPIKYQFVEKLKHNR